MRNVSAFQPNTASGTTKAYYPLNGNSRDYSGNTNTGTDTAITYPQGRFGQGARFDGSSSKITVADSSSLSITGNYTVSFWTKIISNPANNTIEVWLDKVGAGESGGYGIDYYNNAGVMSIRAYHLITTTFYIYTTVQDLGLNKWNLITMTYDGTNQTLYRNGIRIGGQAQTNNPSDNASSLIMGASGASARFIEADIDEVIMESRAWTAKEVETYYRKSMLNYKQKSFASAFAAYIIAIAQGAYTYTGITTGLTSARKIAMDLGTYTYTGIATNLKRGYGIVADLGTYTYTGVATGLSFARRMIASLGTYTYTGVAVNFLKGFGILAETGSYILTGMNTILRSSNIWTNITKSVSSWTNSSKNNATMSNQTKTDSTWVNTPKS